MNKKENKFNRVERQYTITSYELKNNLGIEGEIVAINLQTGRSPIQIAEGKSADEDLWEIQTNQEEEE